ncbi:hypothetical protein D9980_15105 [Serratia sp. 3ACOL1]|uniref:hypothetical protein n=1 Tax=Serratia sp. 3ACOL1 TaxID=2448483 RepID=UPI000EF517E4|nr:hypothetical protein [Serratia sp. 3ACOL1]AYM91791.1 hypothetical protein D9980_15105 [Serratia sp. 3ACOL1]
MVLHDECALPNVNFFIFYVSLIFSGTVIYRFYIGMMLGSDVDFDHGNEFKVILMVAKKLTRRLFPSDYIRGLLITLMTGFAASAQAHNLSQMDMPPLEVQPAPSCDIQAPDGGEYAYAQLHASQFQARQSTALPPMTRRWAVVCDAPTALTLQVRDVQSSSAPMGDSTQFGLGKVNGSGNLGHYQITLSHADIDGRAAQLYETSDASAPGIAAGQWAISTEKYYGWTERDGGASHGKLFAADITVSPVLNSLQLTNGPLVNGAELNGLAEVIFTFGL